MADHQGLTRLPTRHALTGAPIPREQRLGSKRPVFGGELIPFEESITLWLWAYPRLLGWPRAITWLFSPVTGRTTYPGDLWGLDSQGDLLVVETKLQRERSLQDPFEDFVPYCHNKKSKEYWSLASLKSHWEEQLAKKKRVDCSDSKQATNAHSLRGSFPGVLPFSSHGAAVGHWPDLYQRRIARQFSLGRYEAAVRESFSLRKARQNEPPIFVGLVGIIQPEDLRPLDRRWSRDFRLSAKGWKAFESLREHQEAHLRAIRARWHDVEHTTIQIHCWTPDGSAAARRVFSSLLMADG